MIVFSQQLASLLESGNAIVPSLESLRQQVGNRAFKKVIAAVIDDLRIGQSFAEALTRHHQAFSEVYCKTIRAGEQAGNLEVVLRQMAGYLEKRELAKKKARRALTYPVVVSLIALGVVALLITVALPPMIQMFANAGGELPLPTRMLIGLTNFVTAYKLYILIAVISVVVLALWYLKRPSGRRQFHRLLLKAPIIGSMNIATQMARFSRTMSMLLQAGLPVHEIMELVVKTTTNEEARSALNKVNTELLRGHGLAEPMSKIDIFPKLMVEMVTVGEESGSLDSNFADMANLYEGIANDKVNAVVGVIQPAMTISIALLVGFIAISVIMPMYSILGTLD